MTRFMLTVSNLHDTLATISYVALLGIWFASRNDRYWLVILLATIPSGMLLNVFMKYEFHRARPVFDQPLLTLSTYSFPSGHAENATLLYGVLAAYFVARLRSWRWSVAIFFAAGMMVALVGLSRMYLGVHYLSDVLAGVIEGVAWLVLCLTAAASWRKRRAH
jgi:undecaprenyl-diphosphatase